MKIKAVCVHSNQYLKLSSKTLIPSSFISEKILNVFSKYFNNECVSINVIEEKVPMNGEGHI